MMYEHRTKLIWLVREEGQGDLWLLIRDHIHDDDDHDHGDPGDPSFLTRVQLIQFAPPCA